jgi:hypothetical protein
LYQVVEVQGRSGLPHVHAVGWRPFESDLANLLTRLQAGEVAGLTKAELRPVEDLGFSAITVSLQPAILYQQFSELTEEQADKVARLATRLQWHYCTSSCTTNVPEGQECYHYFPRLPSLLPAVVARPPDPVHGEEWAKKQLLATETVHCKVQQWLREERTAIQARAGQEDRVAALVCLLRQVAAPPQPLSSGGWSWADVEFLPDPDRKWDRLSIQLMQLFGSSHRDNVLLTAYHASLSIRRHARYLPRRLVSEAWVNGFNPWVLLACQSNVDVNLVLHTPTSVYSYVGKGTRQVSLNSAISELERRGRPEDLAAAKCLQTALEEGMREVPIMEAIYRADSRLSLVTSYPTRVYYVSAKLGPQGEVAASAKKYRYARRPSNLDCLTLCQFVMNYRVTIRRDQAAKPRHQAAVRIATPADMPAPPGQSTMPSVIYLEDGTKMQLLQEARPVDWGPRGNYGEILLFKVGYTQMVNC